MAARRRRSAAITLVLAGTLSGCSEPVPQRDVYTSIADCQRDWPGAQYCEPVRDGRYSKSWFYGPSYFGEVWPNGRPRASMNAVEAIAAQGRTPTASASRSYWSSGGSSSATSTFRSGSSSSSSSGSVSRGGFGSSASSSGG